MCVITCVCGCREKQFHLAQCRLVSMKQAADAAGRKICFIGLISYLEAAHHSAAELYTSIDLRVM